MAIVTVNVTQDCIDRGERENCEKCPVALAMLQAGFVAPQVDGCSLGWTEPGRGVAVYISTPSDVAFFIDEFDGSWIDEEDGKAVNNGEPFSFTVDTDAAQGHDAILGYDDYATETP